MRGALLTATAVLAALGAALDLYSLVLTLRRRRRGGGPSGVAGAAWFAYLSYSMARRSLLTLLALTGFHALCHFALPALDRKLARRPAVRA